MAKKNFKKVNIDFGNLKDVLTDTISTVTDRVLDIADAAADTAKAGQQIAKLFMEKKKEESALEDAYKELGKLYYELHKPDADGVLADLCAEIENTLINIEDISAEIEALKESANAEFEEMPEADDDDFEPVPEEDDSDLIEQVEETLEEAFEAVEDAVEALLDPEDDDEIEVSVEEYLDDDDFVAPEQDNDVEVEIVEVSAEDEIPVITE